jgi:putative ABC transport system permease protein
MPPVSAAPATHGQLRAASRGISFVDRLIEAVGIAFDVLRVSKLRSGLTMLGVVIGVATVMSMAAVVQGIRDQIVHVIEVAGPTTFYVVRYFSQTPVNPDNPPKEVRIRPALEPEVAERLARLPEIRYASLWAKSLARIEYAGEETQTMALFGADAGFPLIQGGDVSEGRWFTRAEELSGAAVAVVDASSAHRLFGHTDPIDKTVRIGGRPVRIIGLYQPAANVFAPPGAETGAILPYLLMDRQFKLDRANALWIPIKPRPGVSVTDAQAAVTVAIREMRHLHPGDPNTFDLLTQDQILASFNRFTGAFFWIMIALASVALLVGGIGVMAMMMVSVTARTREIGIRKSLGATRLDILMQFLIEASVLTGIGGVVGLVLGLGAGRLLSVVMGITAGAPWLLTVIAVTVSISIGVVFGLVPAIRAARLQPIDALAYE